MCDACYRDCLRGEGKPRWVGLSKYFICKHCFLCCLSDSCSCECITEWGPTQHLDDSELQLWLNYFQRNTVQVNENKEYHICKADKAYISRDMSSSLIFVNTSETTSHMNPIVHISDLSKPIIHAYDNQEEAKLWILNAPLSFCPVLNSRCSCTI